MRLSDLKLKKSKEKKRVGRGGKKGKTSGRGMNGQKSRSGARIRPAERDLIKKIPKLRGYRFNPIKKKPYVLNLKTLKEKFSEGDLVSFDSLKEKGLIDGIKSKRHKIKILGNGEIDFALNISSRIMLSDSALKKIEKSGGKIIEEKE